MHDRYVGKFADGFKQHALKLVSEQETAHRELVARWGDKQSESYKREVELMSRAARNLGIADALRQGGLITGDGGVVSNPWDKRSLNVTEQGKLVRSDPNKARALIRAAGKDPAVYGL
jgi:hypothetical protein